MEKTKQVVKDLSKKISDIFKEVSDELSDAFDKLQDTIQDAFHQQHKQIDDFFDKFNIPDTYDWLPDTVKDWLDIPRSGEYHVYDPLVLDLDGNGRIDVVDNNGYQGALFDHDGDGIATSTSWVSGSDGFLVLDRNNNGVIDSGHELFGDGTLLSNGFLARHGYEALAEFDTNADGMIDVDDEVYSHLKIWQDKNGDGVSTQDEMTSLVGLGINSLSLIYRNINQTIDKGAIMTQQSNYFKDDIAYLMADLQFEYNSIYSRYTQPLQLSDT